MSCTTKEAWMSTSPPVRALSQSRSPRTTVVVVVEELLVVEEVDEVVLDVDDVDEVVEELDVVVEVGMGAISFADAKALTLGWVRPLFVSVSRSPFITITDLSSLGERKLPVSTYA
jgi:hypothetical protein